MIDADGLLVTPGWVDVHTHYDGQATWDPVLAPSSWHGVTTILFGNCGVGFAPVRREHRGGLIDLMEAVEDIPGTALAEGLNWEWESFPEYLDALDRMPRTIDVAAQLPHHPLRVYVMGERGIGREAATPEDIADDAPPDRGGAARRRVRLHHLAHLFAQDQDRRTGAGARRRGGANCTGIGRAMAAVGAGAFGMNSDFEDEARRIRLDDPAVGETGRPVWFLLTDRPTDPERWRRLMQRRAPGTCGGRAITAQVAGRPVGVIIGHRQLVQPVLDPPEPTSRSMACRRAERWARLRDPTVRPAILAEEPSEAELEPARQLSQLGRDRWDRMYVMGDPPDYEPTRRTEHRGDRGAQQSTPAGGRLRLPDRGGRTGSCSSRSSTMSTATTSRSARC